MGNRHLSVSSEMVFYHQNIFLQTFPGFQTQVIKVDELQRMCGHNVFRRGFGLLGFESEAWITLFNMLLCLGSHVRQKEPDMHEVKHVFWT